MMKIYQFTPPATAPSGQARPKAAPNAPDFAGFLNKATAGGAQAASHIISFENARAAQVPSAADLGAAGRLLNSLSGAIMSADAERLGQVHNLEGLLYVRQSQVRA